MYIYTIVSALEGETSLSVTVITLAREEVEFPDELPLRCKKVFFALSSSTFSNPFPHNSITLLLLSSRRSLTASIPILSVSVKLQCRWRGHNGRFVSLYNQFLGSGDGM